jgi:hypothetical protein
MYFVRYDCIRIVERFTNMDTKVISNEILGKSEDEIRNYCDKKFTISLRRDPLQIEIIGFWVVDKPTSIEE